MKRRLVSALESAPLVGDLYRKLEERLFFRHVRRLRLEAGSRLAAMSENTVTAGIFKGMRLHPQSAFGVDQFTMLSGQYESELYGIVSAAAKNGYDLFVDLGCANGFYAVGFAMISDHCDVIAYDILPEARRITQLNAELNNVSSRISVRGEADHAELSRTLQSADRPFILVDIEGAEMDLIDVEKCPALLKCDLLVEVHGETDRVASIISGRFNKNHRCTLIGKLPRNPFDFGGLHLAFEDQAWPLVSEGRTFAKNHWVALERIDS